MSLHILIVDIINKMTLVLFISNFKYLFRFGAGFPPAIRYNYAIYRFITPIL